MWPDRVSNPRLLALESDALPAALRGPAIYLFVVLYYNYSFIVYLIKWEL